MSGFFQTLIAKHQSSGASTAGTESRHPSTDNTGTIHFAQPRPKSRYESFQGETDQQPEELAAAGEAAQGDSATVLQPNLATNPSAGVAQPLRQPNPQPINADNSVMSEPKATAAPKPNTLPANAAATLPANYVSHIARTLGDKVKGVQRPGDTVSAADVQSDRQQSGMTGLAPNPLAESAAPLNSPPQDFSLASSQRWQAQGSPGEGGNESPKPLATADIQAVASSLMVADKSSHGLFASPPQIKQLQTGLLSRELNPLRARAEQPPQETVVNVTIGRVEVKATMAPAATDKTMLGKVSGVMTLNEYLDKRDRRGDS